MMRLIVEDDDDLLAAGQPRGGDRNLVCACAPMETYIKATNKVVGISKLARVVHGFARRLQIQEKLPQGVGVVIEGEHSCMTLRGVNMFGSTLTTSRLLGVVRDDPRTREEFVSIVRGA